jgi:hypothetical protein
MKKLLTLIGAAAAVALGVFALAIAPASADPMNKLPGVADCGDAGTFNVYIANTNAFLGEKVGATAINTDGPGAGVVFGQEGVGTFRGIKPYAERGVAENLTSCDVTVFTPLGPVPFEDVWVRLGGTVG